MVIQIDSREKERAITKIVTEFDQHNIKHPVSKLLVGDYMNYDNPGRIVDRKQNLTELCSNVCQGHDRFRRELVRAMENEIELVFLIEHGKGIAKLKDVIWWNNPRSVKRVRGVDGRWKDMETNAMQGEVLYKILCTMQRKYNCRFLFCSKEETGRRIIELLGGEPVDGGRN